ncbi:MAG: response regulator [Saprospiraceae bacterium]|nr:response regulator [Saprospiraceae bacterium]
MTSFGRHSYLKNRDYYDSLLKFYLQQAYYDNYTMKKANILIIEDHDAVRLLLGLTFKQQYHVVTKRDGIEGLAWLAAGNMPDLIMLDMQMPRLNGLEFLRQLRSTGFFAQIPVLLVSGNDDAIENAQVFDLGIVDFVPKPFNPVSLRDRVTAILDKQKAVAAAA